MDEKSQKEQRLKNQNQSIVNPLLNSLIITKRRELRSEIKRLKRSETKTLLALEECSHWQRKEHEANLLKAHFTQLKKGMKQITLLDWIQEGVEISLELDETKTPQELIKNWFKKAKKLKTGIIYQEKQLLFTQSKLAEKEKLLDQMEKIHSMEDFQNLFPKKIAKKKSNEIKADKKNLPYRHYRSHSGISILVGKNGQANDALTFQHANGSDLWMHVKDFPGSHVIIKKGKLSKIDQETVEEAAQLAIFYSKANHLNEAEICLTERKYVSRIGKQKNGKVQLSKQKNFYVKRNLKKVQEIRGRSFG